MRCDFVLLYEKDKKYQYKCIRCQRRIGWTTTQFNPYARCHKSGVGDRIEKFLRFIRIRRDYCLGCNTRKEKLNELDRKFYRFIRGPSDGSYSVKTFQ